MDSNYKGQAKLLSFGSTVGNAIEACHNFTNMPSGEALCLGMLPLIESRVLHKRCKDLLQKYNIATTQNYSAREIMSFIYPRYTLKQSKLQLVRTKSLGSAYFDTVSLKELEMLISDIAFPL
jgi:3-dehydroquinate synthetase